MNTVLLTTERLVLRRFTDADADHIFALDNDPDVMRYLNGGTPTSRDVIENQILPTFLHYDANQPGLGFWAVEPIASDEFLGWVSLRLTDDVPGEAVLGYRFCKATWGKGYATEACRGLIEKGLADMGVERVIATTYQDNVGSQRVMEKLGMTLVRRFRLTLEDLGQSDTYQSDGDDLWDGDDLEYAVDKREWVAQ